VRSHVIPFDFQYLQPTSLEEAIEAFARAEEDGLQPVYWAGGTEILTFGRTMELSCGAVVDLKEIPELRRHELRDGEIHLGAALTLAEVCERDLFPLLTKAAGRVADHTARYKITLGGDIAGRVPYREAALPFLLAESSRARLRSSMGERTVPFAEVFDGALRLERPDEVLVELTLDEDDARCPAFHRKETRLDWVDYPLLTLAGLRRGDEVRFAFSGLTAEPFRSGTMERALAGRGSPMERAERALEEVPGQVMDDIHGTAAYRRFVARTALEDLYSDLGE